MFALPILLRDRNYTVVIELYLQQECKKKLNKYHEIRQLLDHSLFHHLDRSENLN
tara:strand:- start:1357 stop:1521 length:165 start_codon:yes stop_codon:yes gene_type:complete